ncbi:2-phytyl-1,4-beta-naphthoquinone methyltransferase, chloroplastic-like [Bidens hawaiensis]|uniref:2-phytyl-1,4-beta-naphthoquinone methyltransferase, chloroplastic-like n=1 Tax=Bidens hawaiensis TaxID=980011 RepID=UPI004049B339
MTSQSSVLPQLSFAPSVAGRRRRQQQQQIIMASGDRQALFNRIAPVYDNLNDVLSLGQHRIWKRMAVDWTGAKEGCNALDLCCGSGDLAFLLSQKVGLHGQVIGFDFSRQQLDIASSRQKLHPKACYRNLKWVEGDALDLPFSDCYFDAITMGYGLRNVIDKYKAMKEVYRVLKPGSKASILDFNKTTDEFRTTIQGWMIDNIVVPVAASYGLSEEYRYLKTSIQEFYTGEELEHLALKAGFSSAKHFEVGGGLMGNLVATR